MPHPETRVGYFTFEGLDGPRRRFYFDEPLALGLLRVLERAANSAGGDGTSGEIEIPSDFVEAWRQWNERGTCWCQSGNYQHVERAPRAIRGWYSECYRVPHLEAGADK